jgi:hypothetical protein
MYKAQICKISKQAALGDFFFVQRFCFWPCNGNVGSTYSSTLDTYSGTSGTYSGTYITT